MASRGAYLYRLIAELKRRRVIRVAVVYLVAAWGAIEVGETILPNVGAPAWTVTAVIVFAALGLPVALILSWLFDFTPEGVERTAPADGRWPANPWRRVVRGIVASLAVAVPLSLGGLYVSARASGPDLDPERVAVMPFGTGGVAAELAYLGSGIRIALSHLLSAQGVPAAVPVESVDRGLHEAGRAPDERPADELAVQVGRRLGAGRTLVGDVIGIADRLRVDFVVYDTRRGRPMLRGSIDEPQDSLHRLFDRLAVQVTASVAASGMEPAQLASLTTASLPALRAYLKGADAQRRGLHNDAVGALDLAVDLDSTFAAAALKLDRALGWAGYPPSRNGSRAIRLAHKHQEGLSDSDRRYLRARNPLYPGLIVESRFIQERERAVRLAPDDLDLRFLLGDAYYHNGAAIGMADASARSESLFIDIYEEDSTSVEVLTHLYDLAKERQDVAALRRWGDRILELSPTAALSLRVLRDRARWPEVGRRGNPIDLDTMPARIVASLWEDTADINALMRAIERAEDQDVHRVLRTEAIHAAVAEGRPSVVWTLVDPTNHTLRLALAMFWLEDGARAAMEATAVQNQVEDFAAETADPFEMWEYALRSCLLATWRLQAGHPGEALRRMYDLGREIDEWLARAKADATDSDMDGRSDRIEMFVALAQVCEMTIQATVAVDSGAADAPRRVELLDRRMKEFPMAGSLYMMSVNPQLVRLWQRLGQPHRALQASRRLMRIPWYRLLAVDHLLLEAELTDLIGQQAEAIRLYGRYIETRPRAEAPFDRKVDRARERVAALAMTPATH